MRGNRRGDQAWHELARGRSRGLGAGRTRNEHSGESPRGGKQAARRVRCGAEGPGARRAAWAAAPRDKLRRNEERRLSKDGAISSGGSRERLRGAAGQEVDLKSSWASPAPGPWLWGTEQGKEGRKRALTVMVSLTAFRFAAAAADPAPLLLAMAEAEGGGRRALTGTGAPSFLLGNHTARSGLTPAGPASRAVRQREAAVI